ncbi:MAG: ABC transporter permease [Planctomycetes bacterium]|nr:ABC transporter permease [Planctomycetota bacterium]
MSLFKIAWRSIQQRGLGSTLTILSMALGVALIVAVLVLRGMVDESFRRGAQGYNLIVGKKGSPLQLVLNTVYHLGTPGEPIPWTYYEEFLPEGQWGGKVAAAIPICLGDNFQGYRVIGTTPDLFTKIEYAYGRPYEFAAGRNFGEEAAEAAEHGHAHDHAHGHDHGHDHDHVKKEAKTRQPTMVSPDDSDENEEHHHDLPPHFLEAVIGARVARDTGLKVGDTFEPTHGVSSGEEGHKHDPFTVVGVLKPTGTPNDQALFVNVEGFLAMDGHSKDGSHHHGPLPVELREVSAVLVKVDPNNPFAANGIYREVNEGLEAQAAYPLREISILMETFVGPIATVLLVIAVLVVIVASVGIIVGIYNSMNERRREIAIMRSLGARRGSVLSVIMLESLLLALCGGVAGFLLGHLLIGAASPYVLARTGVEIGALQFPTVEIPFMEGVLIVPIELVLLPGLVLLAGIVGYFPARAAYKTDVSRALSNAN